MSKPLTAGEKARRANIRKFKAIGAANAKATAARKVANYLAHVERCNAAAEAAAARRAERIAAHQTRNARAAMDAVIDRKVAKMTAAQAANDAAPADQAA